MAPLEVGASFNGAALRLRGSGFSRNAKLESLVRSSLVEGPVLWAGRLCVFYALLKAGLAGSRSSPLSPSGSSMFILFESLIRCIPLFFLISVLHLIGCPLSPPHSLCLPRFWGRE